MKSRKERISSIKHKKLKQFEFAENVCRGCLFVSPMALRPINDDIMDTFINITGINLTREYRIPHKLCTNCSWSVKRCLKFKRKCLLSNRILHRLLEASLESNGQFDLNNLRKERWMHPEFNNHFLDLANTLTVECVQTLDSVDINEDPQTFTNTVGCSRTDPFAELKEDGLPSIPNFVDERLIQSLDHSNSNPESLYNQISAKFYVVDSFVQDKINTYLLNDNKLNNLKLEETIIKDEFDVGNDNDPIAGLLDDHLDGVSISSSVKEEVLDGFKKIRKRKKKKFKKSTHKIEKVIEPELLKKKKTKPYKEETHNENICDSGKGKIIKKDQRIYYRYDEDSVNVLMLSVDEQIRELEEIRQSKSYIEAPFKCKTCAKYFSYELSWKGHLAKHEESAGTFVCTICQQRFSSSRNLSRHSSGHEKRFECKQCMKVLHATTSMGQHIAKHNGTSHTYICGICDFTSMSNSSHRRHVITHTDEDKRYKCPYCPKAFNHCTTRNDHAIRAHTGQKNFACDVCKMTFVNKTALKSHSVTHSERKDFYCVECDKSFKTHSSLANHLNLTSSHGNPAYLKFPCSQCDKRYDSAQKLKAHVDCTHLQIFKWACDKCSARFRSPGGIKQHRERYHEGKVMPKIHECETCGRVFASKAILRIHFRIHTGERPYVCEICDRPFRQEAAMRTHVKLVHLKLKRPFRSKNNTNAAVESHDNASETNLTAAVVSEDSAR